MINAAIVGLGWWGKVLVQSVQGKSDKIRFTCGATRTKAAAEDFAKEQGFELRDSYEEVLKDDAIDAVILATPHSQHMDQIVAAAAAGKHVYAEKPLTLTKETAEQAVAAVEKAGVALGIGYLRRLHPATAEMRRRIKDGELGTVLQCETTMTAPNGLVLPAKHWRANSAETPAGGMTGLGVHMVDAMIDFFGPIDEVFCYSTHRAVPNDTDDATTVLLRMKNGVLGYLGTMLATPFAYRITTYGTKGIAQISKPDLSRFEWTPNEPAAPTGQLPTPETEVTDYSGFNGVQAVLETFADAAAGGAPFPIPPTDMIHSTAALEAIVKSAQIGQPQKVA